MDYRAVFGLLPKFRRLIFGSRAFRQQQIAYKASAFISVYGLLAYDEARAVAREAHEAKQYREATFWSQVALAIADKQHRTVGISGADRYPR